MNKVNNLTAGMADPFWYEWSVGLVHALDLLYVDANIKSVVLQASKLQGLDDVVVNYLSGDAECIQIKHTRENDSLTFSDMVKKENNKEDNKGSYLHQFSSDWIRASKEYKKCNAVLFTNRNIGVRKYNVKDSGSEPYERPALEKFWPYIKEKISNASKLQEIVVKKEWESAWNEWLNELNDLDDVQKINFLKSFDIKANQEDLDEIISSIGEKIASYFKVDSRVAVQLHKSLCYALMEWTTTRRKKEEITKEDLLEALALNSDNYKGIHDVPTTEPFFSSRVDFVTRLEEILQKREYPVVFLSGDPGSGKTNIVSHLTNKVNSIITLRFYAFKPLSAGDLYLSADKGVSDPRALWGDLLIQLRELLKGKLAKHRVPISNELLSTTEELRKEVLRLSEELAGETSNTTVICIDGIDHAARAGGENTFLETLVPPEGVPKNVCFLIAGQPIHEYKSYPDWLSDEKVLKVDVPQLDEEDIRQLYNNINTNISVEYSNVAIKVIKESAKGNTLSAIFAIYEAKYCDNIGQLEECLNNKKLSSGINAYYEYIWKSALENIPSNFFYVDGIVAGVLSLINKRINTGVISDIYGDSSINENAWKRILQKLYPVVIEEDGDFRVFHNDVRIYLEKYLRKNLSTFIEVASKIADYYIYKSTDAISRHELVFGLLKYAKKTKDYIRVFTKEYVTEAIKIARPMEELIEQLEETLESIIDIDDYKRIINFSCAVSTLHQFIQSLQWADRVYKPDIPLPDVLNSERKVVHKSLLTLEAFVSMFADVQLLIEHEKTERAGYILEKWLSNLTPEEIIDILIENHQLLEEGEANGLSESLEHILEKWGRFCQYTGINYEIMVDTEKPSEFQKQARLFFAKGWLDEGQNFTRDEDVIQTVDGINFGFKDDIESFIAAIMEANNVDMVKKLTNKYEEREFSTAFNVKLAAWAISNFKEAEYEVLIDDIGAKGFYYVKELRDMSDRDVFPIYALIAFILSYKECSFEKINELYFDVFKQGKSKEKEREYHAAYCLVSVSVYLGYINKCISKKQASEKISIASYQRNVMFLLNENNLIGRIEIGGNKAEEYLLNHYINIANNIGQEFSDALQTVLLERAHNYKNIRHLDIYWTFLRRLGKLKVLEGIFDYWMSEDGVVWDQEIAEMTEIADGFIIKACELGWTEKAEKAKNILKQKSIGYVGSKEYSLYTPLQWYKRIDMMTKGYWDSLGLHLLNISQNASELGDNRAAVSIDSAVAASAGREGCQSLWRFAKLTNKWDKQWVQTIFDGVISALENNLFSVEELTTIWELATRIFFVYDSDDRYDTDNNFRKIYITDIKEGILLAAKRLDYYNIEDNLEEISEYEYGLERVGKETHSYIIPTRWFDSDVTNKKVVGNLADDIKKMTCEEAKRYVIEQFITKRSSFRWDFVVELIQKYKNEKPEEIKECVAEMYELLMQRKDAYSWDWDGANRGFEAVFPYLDEEKIKVILSKLVMDYFAYETSGDEIRVNHINSDLENFLYCYYETLPLEDSVNALKLILEMHAGWLTGNGTLPLKTYYTNNDELDIPLNWIDFCNKIREKIYYL